MEETIEETMKEMMQIDEEENPTQSMNMVLKKGVNKHKFKDLFKKNFVHFAILDNDKEKTHPSILGFASILRCDYNMNFDCHMDLAVC